MYDVELVKDILKNILWSIDQIEKRSKNIKSSDDFLNDDLGLEKLDSICMQLINIGEALKKIDKITNGKLFDKNDQIEWKKAMGMRDIITHHYFDIDSEIVYSVCKTRIPKMKREIKKILKTLNNKDKA